MKRNASRLVLGGLVAALLGISTLTGCHDGSPTVPGVPGDPAPSTSQAADPSLSSPSQQATEPMTVKTEVIRVIDGDTIAVRPVASALQPTNDAGTQHTVRLLGIDAAEMNYGKETGPECGAREAADHLESILPEGMPVIVSYDPKADRTDRYSRSLAYVTTRGGTDAGLRQVADGYAMPWYPESEPEPERVAEYRMAADAAVKHRAGAHSRARLLAVDNPPEPGSGVCPSTRHTGWIPVPGAALVSRLRG